MRRVDITGQICGQLQVVSMLPAVKGKSKWLCLCACGKSTVYNYQHLKDGMVNSCGCRRGSRAKENASKGAYKISGSKSYMYKPELTEEYREKSRNTPELRYWRKQVLLRDTYVCINCKLKANTAHHLFSWVSHPKLRYDVTNGVSMCKECHLNFHRYIGTRTLCTGAMLYMYIQREIKRIKEAK
jgi:hypothetical protein